MLKAANKFIQALEIKTEGFAVTDASLKTAKVISMGSGVKDIKKGATILFPFPHGKAMQHTIEGKSYYFVDADIILASE